MTARELVSALADVDCLPVVAADCLTFDSDPPAELEAVLVILHTGIRAVLTKQPWLGCDADGRPVVLSVDRPLPAGLTLLAVAGDARWDRVRAAERLAAPAVFDVPVPRPARAKPPRTPTSEKVLL